MEILSILLLGISLSMDAFSLALCYGTLDFTERKRRQLSSIVGAYHFIMPQLGMYTAHLISSFILIETRYIVFFIFLFIGVEMLLNSQHHKEKSILLNIFGFLLFGFTVSVDSFSTGIGLEFISDKHLLCSLVFSLTSAFFTYSGLKLGGKLNKKFNDLAQVIGAIILIILAVTYLFK